MADRVAQMGHASDSMTLRYSHSDLERRRAVVEDIGRQLSAAGEEQNLSRGLEKTA